MVRLREMIGNKEQQYRFLEQAMNDIANDEKILRDRKLTFRDTARQMGYAVDFINRKLIKK